MKYSKVFIIPAILAFSIPQLSFAQVNGQVPSFANSPKSIQSSGTLDGQLQKKQIDAAQAQQFQQTTQNSVNDPNTPQDGSLVVVQEDELPWLKKKEPPKSTTNLLRLTFEEVQEVLSPEDKTALKSVINRISKDINSKLVLKSYAKPRGENVIKARQAALRRVLEIRKFFEDNGIDFKRVTIQVLGDSENSLGLDYIDLDKA